jgi:spermidine synthase
VPARWPLLLLAFGLSGFAGLVYQIAWTREFAFVFGTSELAVATVLAAYFAGLAAGAALAGRVVSRVPRPVILYGLLELAIAAAALTVPVALRGAMRLHVALFAHGSGALEEAGWPSALFYLAASFAILLVPTGCMGATLPLLTRYAVRREEELGRRVGLLYGMNTLGAVLGTVAAGFVLLPTLGLERTVELAAAVNALVFVLALLVARAERTPPTFFSPSPDRTALPRLVWVLPLIGISGGVSFLYEVLWTRLLIHGLGGSLYAFATMLATFLAGIALGSAGASPWARNTRSAGRGFVVAQLATALLSAAAYACLDLMPHAAPLLDQRGIRGAGFDALFAASVLLPSALAIGATFPFAVRILARDAAEAGVASARVYAWNTVGAIVGAVGAGFLVIPWLGFAGAATLAVGTNLALAAVAAWKTEGRLGWSGGLAIAGLALLAVLPPGPPERLLRSSPFSLRPTPGEVVYRGVGRTASVLVLETQGEWLLRMNGLPESTVQPEGARAQRYSVAQWLGALPVLMRPGLESLLVIGLGGGIALEGVPPSVRSIDVIEIEREAVRANRALAGRRRHDPLSDPRVRIHVNDARNALLLSRQRFDAIVSQPSHPWTSGAAHLYTREFFELAGSRLAPDGVFVQWIGLHFVDEPLLRTLVATLCDVFPYVRAYRPARRPALLFAASARPFANRDEIDAALERQSEHFAGFGLFDVLDLEAAWFLDEAGATAFAGEALLNRDAHNRLEIRSPRVVRSPNQRSLLGVLAGFDPLPRRAAALRPAATARRLLERGAAGRAQRLETRSPAGAERAAVRGLVSLATRRSSRARRQLRAALEHDPRHPEARAAWLRLNAGAIVPPLAEPLNPLEESCWLAWAERRRDRWQGVRRLDATLSQAHPREPLFREATRLRAWWRVASGKPALGREALTILDPILAASEHPGDLLLRARAALLADRPRGAVSTLDELLQATPAAARRETIRSGIRDLLARLPGDPPFPAWKRALEARLQGTPALPSRSAPP